MKKFIPSNKINLLLVIFSVLLSSCSIFFHPKTTVDFKNQTENSTVKIHRGGDTPYEKKNGTNGFIESEKFGNEDRFILITQEKKGYVKQFNVMLPTKFNYLRAVDGIFAVALFSAGAGILASGDDDKSTLALMLMGAGVFALDGVIVPTGLYKSSFEFPEMVQYVKRKEDQRYLFVANMGLDVDSKDLTIDHYKNWKKYTSGSKSSTVTYDERVQYTNTIFTDGMNEVLFDCNFMDTTGKLIANNYNSYYLDAKIKKMQFKVIYYGMESATMLIEWELKDYATKETVGKYSTEVTSDFFPFGNDYLKDGIKNCLEKSMFKLMADNEFNSKLKAADIEATMKDWDEISLTNKGTNATDLSSVVKSSVIVNLSDGHGSGIIITKDGYALTNYHVVGGEDTVEVIFSDQTKSKAVVVRSNPKYDLALIKIEGKEFNPPLIDLAHKTEVANEVVAVGTPKDIELGQTITKGIISGYRDNGDFKLIQTDAKISPGNSGGALIDMSSKKLVGIVNAKIIGYGVEGIGFAIPIDLVESALKIKLN